MITAPLSTPRTGHLLFSEKLCLMVRVGKVSHDGFSFHVVNFSPLKEGACAERRKAHG